MKHIVTVHKEVLTMYELSLDEVEEILRTHFKLKDAEIRWEVGEYVRGCSLSVIRTSTDEATGIERKQVQGGWKYCEGFMTLVWDNPCPDRPIEFIKFIKTNTLPADKTWLINKVERPHGSLPKIALQVNHTIGTGYINCIILYAEEP